MSEQTLSSCQSITSQKLWEAPFQLTVQQLRICLWLLDAYLNLLIL